ncbi:MAG: serine hydrolase [Gemmatimonadales bacterium]|nr:serine hydrolase [Gemmatimonadales bacterium]NIN13390.1 serine hydrolase [Gemmatimonadales bacterium]NIN51393.1 serine hydrolase [Gemmatimonadales bacterium]NIP08857.1 serine hydrolase [Gemmatimonadales bacterium]NIQ99851.1 serine hydrolase [Gemmatimonadales bacterium]
MCTLAAVLFPMRTVAQSPPGFDQAWQEIQEFYRSRLEDEGIVGSSLWFLHGGRTLAREFYGMADLAEQRPVNETTIYHWASITKTFTGIAIMQLRDRGQLSLDDPVVHYLPELRKVHNPFGSMEAITIRHLLSHSAGFRGPTWPWGGDEPWHPHEPTTWQQLVAMIPYTQVLFEPGSRYSYSNPGIVFLGRIIEELTGDDYEVYVDKNILKPLGMYGAYFDHTPYHLLPHRSNNYYVTGGELTTNGLDFDTGITVSNGGLNAAIPDMVKYLAFLTGDPRRQHAYDAILPRSSLREMWQPVVDLPLDTTGTEGREPLRESMGLTFFILQHGDLQLIGHTGGQKAFVSFIYLDQTSGAAAIAAFNTLGISPEGRPKPDTRSVLSDLRQRLFSNVFPLFRERG